MHRILSNHLGDRDRYTIHPGDLSWWLYHHDRRLGAPEARIGDDAIAVLEGHDGEVDVFGGDARIDLLDAVRDEAHASVGWGSESDRSMIRALEQRRLEPTDDADIAFDRGLEPLGAPLPDGYVVRCLAGEEEAWSRRAASHAAFASTQDPADHLQRYLSFMRSPVYERERDLVAVTPDGTVASFLIWWEDEATGIAQLEPVGTHPDHQRRGLGAAVFEHALGGMRSAGMRRVRVETGEARTGAVAFYERLGFTRFDRLRWWKAPG